MVCCHCPMRLECIDRVDCGMARDSLRARHIYMFADPFRARIDIRCMAHFLSSSVGRSDLFSSRPCLPLPYDMQLRRVWGDCTACLGDDCEFENSVQRVQHTEHVWAVATVAGSLHRIYGISRDEDRSSWVIRPINPSRERPCHPKQHGGNS